MPKKTIKKVKVKVAEKEIPEVETPEKEILPVAFAVFDHKGTNFIRAYEDEKTAKSFAEKPVNRPEGYNLEDSPGLARVYRPVDKEELSKLEEEKRRFDAIKEKKLQEFGQGAVIKGK